jgi:hypothetical protein
MIPLTALCPTFGGMTMKRMNRNSTFVFFCLLAVSWLFGSAAAKGDVVLTWNEIAVNTAIANAQNPYDQARYAAIAQLAVFEAVNATQGSTNHILER